MKTRMYLPFHSSSTSHWTCLYRSYPPCQRENKKGLFKKNNATKELVSIEWWLGGWCGKRPQSHDVKVCSSAHLLRDSHVFEEKDLQRDKAGQRRLPIFHGFKVTAKNLNIKQLLQQPHVHFVKVRKGAALAATLEGKGRKTLGLLHKNVNSMRQKISVIKMQ